MTKIKLAAIALMALIIAACDNDNAERIHIDSVWMNTTGLPVEQTRFAYPGQTICLKGAGFSSIKRAAVNGYDIDISSSLPYATDTSLIIAIPSDINTSANIESCISLESTEGEYSYFPFYIKPLSEKPSINRLSTTTLSVGETLTAFGVNLESPNAVYLPLCFGHKTKCHIVRSDSTSVTVEIPEGCNFAKGKMQIVLSRINPFDNLEYLEIVYSEETDFKSAL